MSLSQVPEAQELGQSVDPNLDSSGLSSDELGVKNLVSSRFIESSEQPSFYSLTMQHHSFWLGIGSFILASIFDGLSAEEPRTLSLLVGGLAWSHWIGETGGSIYGKKIPHQGHSTLLAPYFRASGQGAIGESSNLFLIPPGVYFHPLHNDVNGNTDKLLTASLKLGHLWVSKSVSIESVAYWRLLTPSFREEFLGAYLKEPAGTYADWGELKTNVAKVLEFSPLDVRIQGSVGYNDIGDKGGKKLHRDIHRLTRNSLENLEYTNQPKGRFFSTGIEVGIAASGYSEEFNLRASQVLSATVENSRMMREFGLKYNFVFVNVPEWWEYGGELKIIRQASSEVYSKLMPTRFEAGFGVRVLRYLTPTVKYVSGYFENDPIGQTYFDILHINLPIN
ncbi:MAG: hypothetical protein NT027_13965 [Proteobacteria bacterium]|nr:hypothetical protein [Pseudomonadota bacterium]